MKYVLAFGLLVALPATAQTAALEPVEVTPFAGYLLGGTFLDYIVPSGIYAPGLHINDHLTYGLRVGYNATTSLEPEIQWSHTETSVQGNPAPEALSIDFFIAGLTYNLCSGRFRPYVSGGLGAGLYDGLNHSQLTLFTTSLAVGAKYFFTPNVGLRLEARGYASEPGSIIQTTCPYSCHNNWIFNGDYTGGVTIAF